MKKLFKMIFYSCLFLIGICSFLLFTTPGLYTAINLGKLFLPGTLIAQDMEGRLLDQFSIEELNYDYNSIHFKISKLAIKWNLRTLLDYRLRVNEVHAESIVVNEQNATHTLNGIKLSALINKQVLKLESLQFNYLNHTIKSELQIDSQRPHALSGVVKLNSESNNELLKGAIHIGGTIKQLQWTGDFHGLLELSLNGTLNNLSEFNQIIKWHSFKWHSAERIKLESPEGRIKLSGTLPNINMEFSSKIKNNDRINLQINAKIQGTLPWKWNVDAQITQLLDPKSKIEGIYSNLKIKGVLEAINKGTLTLTLAPGHYQMPEDSKIPSLQFVGGVIKASLSANDLSGKGTLDIDSNTKMKLKFSLPKFDLAKKLSTKQSIIAELTLLLNSFDFIKNLSPEISNPQGKLTASVKTRGSLDKLVFESKLNVTKASMALPMLGLNLNSIDFTILARKERWDVKGVISSANKNLFIKGEGILNSTPTGEFTLQGTEFPAINTKEYQINISPQLKFNVSPTNLNITGAIFVPYAQIKPQSFSNSVTVSDDVVYKGKQEAAAVATPFNTSMDIRIEMGKTVELTVKGLHATLAGTVNLKQLPQGPVNANGELNVVQGEYKAYGQDLAIEQGELIFTGGRLDNPGINLRAAKKINTTSSSITSSNQLFDFNNNNLQNANLRGNIKVGVEVTGRLNDPKIQLFSNPSILSQADILSMLVLGRPARQANKAGAQLLLAAISSMNLGTGTNGAQLLDQLKQNLGFDLNVETNSKYNLVTNQVSDNTALVVGKSLSERIYLSYNVGLSQADPNVLTLKYLLNKFLSIQISSSDAGNGIDVLYTTNK